ncbi:MAG: 50S ribosomal protein L18 [Deltaproteobacteria bacterium]|nr:MAG: 50S ribosomal protein L18 [Deltaproteobacteria bacterium]
MTEKVLRKKISSRLKRKKKLKSVLRGTAQRPRLSVFRSNRFIYAQVINDDVAKTLAHVDGAKENFTSSKEGAQKAAAELARRLNEKKISSVVFDRNGYLYHGVIEAFANELRNQSIKV